MSVEGEFGALLAIVTPPVTFPLVDGENFTAKETLAPALMVCAPRPAKLKPEPDGVTLLITSAPPPVFVIVTFCETLLPRATFPNATLAGLSVTCGCACVALPESAMLSGDPGILLAIVTLPDAEPAVVGAKAAVNDVLCPGASVAAESPLMLNPFPEADPDVIDTFAVPVFVSETETVELLPTCTLPKFTLDGLAVN